MIREVYNNIYMFEAKLPKSPLKSINIYVIKDKDKNLVLDTGYHMDETLESMKEGLAELGLEIKDTELFLTHMHADHTGLSYDFYKEGCKVYMGSVDGELVTKDRKSTRLNSSHANISYAVFCLKKKKST